MTEQKLELPPLVESLQELDKSLKKVSFCVSAYLAARIQRDELEISGKDPSQTSNLTPPELNLLSTIQQSSLNLLGHSRSYTEAFSKSVLITSNQCTK